MMDEAAAAAVAWGWEASAIAPHAGGLINATFVVRVAGAPAFALQRLHPIFAAEVNDDIDAVTAHVAARGLVTPRLVRARDGRACVVQDGRVWRALTWIDGTTVHAVPDPAWAESAGALVGRFHRAVADLAYDYKFARAGVHDTAAHLAKLRARATGDGEVAELGRAILAVAAELPELRATERRHVHGDLKISNVIFGAPGQALSLVDLDTLGRGTLAFELGDALRSWCNPRGEDAGDVRFDRAIFAAAVRGFRAVADDIASEREREAVAIGLETVCVELAARFCVDAVDDVYFGWDASRFRSRREHNVVRARGQLALAIAVREARAEMRDVLVG
jgi:Ser/Thr protein kinase RdoA (MazF antagonist)